MDQTTPDVDSIVLAALKQSSPEERAAYLDRACGDDVQLRQRVERLLETRQHATAMADTQASEDVPETAAPGRAAETRAGAIEQPGSEIGPYTLLEKLGEGGFGVVYLAEQKAPVERRVALKILKAGMDTGQVLARFEAERQALAMMDHPGIAKVFDAGATEYGRSYFVMELVEGIPITQYCDEHQLTPKQRLELFIQVCQAVQHAHQKGIIHRDLKPPNILVAEYDQRPAAKVIDFGIAKATTQTLTEKTIFTQEGSIIGTFEYMSPEQAETNPLDIDTRSDIYSLGDPVRATDRCDAAGT